MDVEEKTTMSASVLWRRLDRPGHEACRLTAVESGWQLAGTAVFSHEHQPCRLDYLIVCDPEWHTRSGRVAGWVGEDEIAIELTVDAMRCWRLNGAEVQAATGCVDLDLNFRDRKSVV